MKRYENVEIKRSASGRETLPAGGYVCQIISAKVESGEWGDTLIIAHDVCEGEYAGVFKRDFENSTAEPKKWRGVFRIRLPREDGSQQDAWKKRSLGNTIWAIEQSNPGYAWDWDEKSLKGKKVGLIYRNREWEYEGRSGWTTEAGAAESVDNIREGKFKMLKDKPLTNAPAPAEDIAASEADLPF